ncbi:hypothetical protein EAH89_05410 [Roseomonas nepalensis]|uniref:Uncharacterized protein n=1 Tax=Muricoccus nepalensis TaxID=1854500 RepID=A0A502GCU0_9PROT|nr:hypothetical protein [Roseomonas nepalensis]TPG59674.1 hypothetical protein EAH89_05410 [Roseomonas nepalensis]
MLLRERGGPVPLAPDGLDEGGVVIVPAGEALPVVEQPDDEASDERLAHPSVAGAPTGGMTRATETRLALATGLRMTNRKDGRPVIVEGARSAASARAWAARTGS